MEAVPDFLPGLKFGALLADKAYDANSPREELADHEAEAVIPPKSNQSEAIECDWKMYRKRHLVENFFCHSKRFQRIATGCEKAADSYGYLLHAVGSFWALAQ